MKNRNSKVWLISQPLIQMIVRSKAKYNIGARKTTWSVVHALSVVPAFRRRTISVDRTQTTIQQLREANHIDRWNDEIWRIRVDMLQLFVNSTFCDSAIGVRCRLGAVCAGKCRMRVFWIAT